MLRSTGSVGLFDKGKRPDGGTDGSGELLNL
jgi:hypothetical protein